MDPVTAMLVSEALKLSLQGIFTLAEQAGVKPEDVDKVYQETKAAYEQAKKSLG